MSLFSGWSLDAWETLGDIGTVMVIIGVAGEGIEILVKWKRKEWYHKNESKIDLIGGVFWMLVVAGLAIEFRGNYKAKKIEEENTARLNIEAANARREAGAANERAANSELKVAQLAIGVEQLRSNNLVLASAIAPRRITPLQKETFLRILNDPDNVCKSHITVFMAKVDQETENFAKDFRQMLNEAGYGRSNEPVEIIPDFNVRRNYYDRKAQPLLAVYSNTNLKYLLLLPTILNIRFRCFIRLEKPGRQTQ